MLKLYVKENIFMELIRLENVKKIYQTGEVITKAVDGIDFTVNQGEFALIIGASGAENYRFEHFRRYGYCDQWRCLY